MTSLDVASLHDIATLTGEYTNTASSKRHSFKEEGNRKGKKEWMSAGLHTNTATATLQTWFSFCFFSNFFSLHMVGCGTCCLMEGKMGSKNPKVARDGHMYP
jgi:hypothetical protein